MSSLKVKSTLAGRNKANLASLVAMAGSEEEMLRRRAEMARRYPDEEGPDEHALAWQRSGALSPSAKLDADDRLFTKGSRSLACPSGSKGKCLKCGAAFERTAALAHTCPRCREQQLEALLAEENDGNMVYQEAAC